MAACPGDSLLLHKHSLAFLWTPVLLLLPSLPPSVGQTGLDGLTKQKHVFWTHHPLLPLKVLQPQLTLLKNVNICKTQDKLPLSPWAMDPMQNKGKKRVSRSPWKSPRSWSGPSIACFILVPWNQMHKRQPLNERFADTLLRETYQL